MWNELLGFGDFYYELGVQILEACLGSRSLNGGIMELGQLRAAVTRRRGSLADPISDDDILRAIKKLKVSLNTFVYVEQWTGLRRARCDWICSQLLFCPRMLHTCSNTCVAFQQTVCVYAAKGMSFV